jgi:hypothetical protein
MEAMSTGAPQPISEGPLGVIDLLDGAFGALRQRARTIVAIVAGLVIPNAIFQGWITRDALAGATFVDLVNDPTVAQEVSESSTIYDLGTAFSQLLALLVTAVAGVAVSWVIYGWFEGRDPTARQVVAFTASRMGAILGAFVVIHLLQLVGFVLLVLPGLALIVLSALTSPVLAVENLGPVASMKRSWALVRLRPGPVIGIILLLAGVEFGVSYAVGTLPETGALLLGPDRAWPLVSMSSLLTSVILIPVNGAAMCLVYLDIRFRTEGLDLRRRIEAQFGS